MTAEWTSAELIGQAFHNRVARDVTVVGGYPVLYRESPYVQVAVATSDSAPSWASTTGYFAILVQGTKDPARKTESGYWMDNPRAILAVAYSSAGKVNWDTSDLLAGNRTLEARCDSRLRLKLAGAEQITIGGSLSVDGANLAAAPITVCTCYGSPGSFADIQPAYGTFGTGSAADLIGTDLSENAAQIFGATYQKIPIDRLAETADVLPMVRQCGILQIGVRNVGFRAAPASGTVAWAGPGWGGTHQGQAATLTTLVEISAVQCIDAAVAGAATPALVSRNIERAVQQIVQWVGARQGTYCMWNGSFQLLGVKAVKADHAARPLDGRRDLLWAKVELEVTSAYDAQSA